LSSVLLSLRDSAASADRKMSTSCEQKNEHSKEDSALDTSRIDAASDILSRLSFDSLRRLEGKWLDISKDGELIFKDSPPKEDCQNTTISICANCGKEGSEVTNTCNKCNLVMYCNAVCKKKHRHKHKKDCEEHLRRAAERAAELHDEKLFKQPPPTEDCPICFLQLPYIGTGIVYMDCCGKIICRGCSYAPLYDNQGNKVAGKKCPYCRTPPSSNVEERIKRLEKRLDLNDTQAMYHMGCYYAKGLNGLPQNNSKALELWHRAGELGCSKAHSTIGNVYNLGMMGREVNEQNATHYWELAAINGSVIARFNLGCIEFQAGNHDRALKHFTIAARDGNPDALENIKGMYMDGNTTKYDYTKALRSYQAYLNEIKSDQRDKAAAFCDDFKYIGSANWRRFGLILIDLDSL